MTTAADVRRLALWLEGTLEQQHMDRRAFRVTRIFATLAADERTANLKFTLEEQEFKCLLAPEIFRPLANGWGRQGWTQLDLAQASPGDLAAALKLAHSHSLKTPKR